MLSHEMTYEIRVLVWSTCIGAKLLDCYVEHGTHTGVLNCPALPTLNKEGGGI